MSAAAQGYAVMRELGIPGSLGIEHFLPFGDVGVQQNNMGGRMTPAYNK